MQGNQRTRNLRWRPSNKSRINLNYYRNIPWTDWAQYSRTTGRDLNPRCPAQKTLNRDALQHTAVWTCSQPTNKQTILYLDSPRLIYLSPPTSYGRFLDYDWPIINISSRSLRCHASNNLQRPMSCFGPSQTLITTPICLPSQSKGHFVSSATHCT
jgi:hypothetical protein